MIYTFALWIDHRLNISNHMAKSLYVAVMRIIMMPSCPYFIFIDTSTYKQGDIFIIIGFHLRTSEVKAWGSWYIHFAPYFLTIIYNVFMLNNALWSNSNTFSLIICKVYTKKENAGSWNSGLEKAMSEIPILHISKWAKNLRRIILDI